MEKYSLKFVYQYTFVAAVGGLLFGYDTAVVAGAIGFLQEKYSLSPAMTGWAASCALIGCMVGLVNAYDENTICRRLRIHRCIE